jgi:hypothetical protein
MWIRTIAKIAKDECCKNAQIGFHFTKRVKTRVTEDRNSFDVRYLQSNLS